MTDTFESDDEQDEPTPRDLRHQLAERAREADELRQQLESVKREAEFTKALGTDATAAWTKYFQAGYDGPIEAEAIRKAASEAGFLNRQNATSPADLDAHFRMAQNAYGGDPATTQTWQEALAEADRIQNEAERESAILDVVERYGGYTSRQAQ